MAGLFVVDHDLIVCFVAGKRVLSASVRPMAVRGLVEIAHQWRAWLPRAEDVLAIEADA